MISLDVENLIPTGWSWTIYGPSGDNRQVRVVLVSPDFRVHIGRTANTIEEALRLASEDATTGKRN